MKIGASLVSIRMIRGSWIAMGCSTGEMRLIETANSPFIKINNQIKDLHFKEVTRQLAILGMGKILLAKGMHQVSPKISRIKPPPAPYNSLRQNQSQSMFSNQKYRNQQIYKNHQCVQTKTSRPMIKCKDME